MKITKPMKTWQIIILVILQVIFFFNNIKNIIKPTTNFNFYPPNLQLPSGTTGIIIMILVLLIAAFILFILLFLPSIYTSFKFWEIKRFNFYKIFSILNILFLMPVALAIIVAFFNVITSSGFVFYIPAIIMRIYDGALVIFQIINIVLILNYNKYVHLLFK